MPKEKTLEEKYTKCLADGSFIPQEKIGIHKIKSMIQIAGDDLESAKLLMKEKTPKYGSIYKLYYDALHQLIEALLLFDKIKSKNHECLFSYFCTKHPEFDFDWNFLERIRTKRNGINYYGNPILEKDWKEARLQLELYIKTISDAVNLKIKNHI